MRVRQDGTWSQGKVTNITHYPLSYNVQMPDGQCYRRNRRDILDIPEHSKPMTSERYAIDPRDMTQTVQTPNNNSHRQGENIRRSGRVTRIPERLKDYVLYK